MRLRIPIAIALAPIGLLVGAVLVGRPISVENDIVIDPTRTTVVSEPSSTEPADSQPSGTDQP